MSSTAAAPSAVYQDRRWRMWPAIVLIVAALLALIGLQAYEALSRVARTELSQRLIVHSFEVVMTAQSLRSALQDAERGQRGFLLTGRSGYLEPYRQAVNDIPGLLAKLQRLTASDPKQHAQLAELVPVIDHKLGELGSTVAAYRSGGLSAAQRIIGTDTGLDTMRTIETLTGSIIDSESRLMLRQRAEYAAADITLERVAMASTLLAAVAMIAGLSLALANFRRSRRLQLEISRRAEDAAHANRQLEQRNIELAQAGELARAAQAEARRAEQTKGRFLATASHDLRQPLQAVSLLNGAMRRRESDPDLIDALRQQQESIAAMSRLLNALLDISKLESGAVKPEPADFAVAPMLAAMAGEFRGIAASKGLRIRFEPCEVCARSDPSLIEQILRNLTSNAIKYTREGEVRLRAVSDPPWVRIEVIDTGVGIAGEQIRLIGEEFYQVGVPSNSTREGYGLGLSIVRRLVKLLDLELDIRSEVGKGSTFSLRIRQGAQPRSVAQAPPLAPLTRDEPVRCRHILLVEDDPDVRMATRLLLRTEGYDVAAVARLADALAHVQAAEGVDLLVTDFHLAEGETGLQVIAQVRQSLHVPLTAVLITGDTSSAVKDLPRDPDLRVMSKPVRAEEFLGLVRTLLVS